MDLGKECLCWKEWDIEERPYNVYRNWEEQTQGAGGKHWGSLPDGLEVILTGGGACVVDWLGVILAWS